MLERLTNRERIEAASRRILELLGAHGEWFYVPGEGRAFLALRRSEIELLTAHGRLIFTCRTQEGVRSWHVTAWEWTGARLLLEAKRRAGAERALVELVPRPSAPSTKETSAIISAARRKRAEHLARLACACQAGAKVSRVALNRGARRGESGRYARIELRWREGRIAVSGVVTAAGEAYDVDAFFCSTLVWFLRSCERARSPLTSKLWLIADRKHLAPLSERLSLLSEELRARLSLFEVDDEWLALKRARCPTLEELWARQRRARLARPSPSSPEPSRSAARIAAFAPDAIDIVRARHGETLRYHGLPFARVRRVTGTERVWFGVAEVHPRRLLDESTAPVLAHLLEQLREHRRADGPDPRHALYRLAPEAWLESLLRRDIKRLDPGLRLAPLHAQFRASHDAPRWSRPVDLLALRQDGRLVVIELKVSEDREHVIQGADYWRRVEAHRRAGNLAHAQLFGDARIAEESALVYLVAPTLSFHTTFTTLARTINPRIPVYRFDLNEDWRAGVRVMRRCDLTQ
ncbi:MAG TPA: hypothetical protein VF544_19900 [Pyrinomonadaceae bacterium]|jgi:hypothetical protein